MEHENLFHDTCDTIYLKVTKCSGTLNLAILAFLVLSLNLAHAKPVNTWLIPYIN